MAINIRFSEYPLDWRRISKQTKDEAGWRCERCGVPNDKVPNILTVHHLDGNKWNLQLRNLVALCQKCHLKVQAYSKVKRSGLRSRV